MSTLYRLHNLNDLDFSKGKGHIELRTISLCGFSWTEQPQYTFPPLPYFCVFLFRGQSSTWFHSFYFLVSLSDVISPSIHANLFFFSFSSFISSFASKDTFLEFTARGENDDDISNELTSSVACNNTHACIVVASFHTLIEKEDLTAEYLSFQFVL